MKILEVTCWLPEGGMSGGGAVVCLDCANALSELGAEVSIFAGDYSGTHPRLTITDGTFQDHRVTRISLDHSDRERAHWRKTNPEAVAVFGRWLKANRPDLVHFHSLQGLGFPCLTEAHRRSIPTAVTLHDHWWVSGLRFLTNLRTGHLAWDAKLKTIIKCRREQEVIPELAPLLKPFASANASEAQHRSASRIANVRELLFTHTRSRQILSTADLIIAPSEFLMKIHQQVGLKNITLLRNGAPAELTRIERPSAVNHPIRFGMICGARPWKGVRLAIEAIKQIPGGQAKLRIWGSDAPNDPDAIDPRIKWCGRFTPERRAEIYRSMDVALCLSLHHENSPMAVIEAQAARVPVIATAVGGHLELVVDQLNGHQIGRTEIGRLVWRMKHFVDDPPYVRRLGSEAPQRPSAEQLGERLMELFEPLIAKKAS